MVDILEKTEAPPEIYFDTFEEWQKWSARQEEWTELVDGKVVPPNLGFRFSVFASPVFQTTGSAKGRSFAFPSVSLRCAQTRVFANLYRSVVVNDLSVQVEAGSLMIAPLSPLF